MPFHSSADEPPRPDGFGGAQENAAVSLTNSAFEKISGPQRDPKRLWMKKAKIRTALRRWRRPSSRDFQVMGIDVT
jgi:hypothetical protein